MKKQEQTIKKDDQHKKCCKNRKVKMKKNIYKRRRWQKTRWREEHNRKCIIITHLWSVASSLSSLYLLRVTTSSVILYTSNIFLLLLTAATSSTYTHLANVGKSSGAATEKKNAESGFGSGSGTQHANHINIYRHTYKHTRN